MFLSTLQQPFPINTWRRYWLRGASFGLFVFLFLFLFKPFRLDLYPTTRLLWTTAVYGLTTGVVIFSGSFTLIKIIAPLIDESRWTLGKQILWNTILMVIIALMNVLVTQLMHGMILPLRWYFNMLKWVFMLGVFPVAIAELITYNHFLRKHLKTAGEVSLKLHSKETQSVTDMAERNAQDPPFDKKVDQCTAKHDQSIDKDCNHPGFNNHGSKHNQQEHNPHSLNPIGFNQNWAQYPNSSTEKSHNAPVKHLIDIAGKIYLPIQLENGGSWHTNHGTQDLADRLELTGENQGDKIVLNHANLIAIQALDNYVNVFWDEKGKLQTTMLRNTLTNICQQVKDHNNLYRTHRGWIVNTHRVIKVDGNAQGLKLSLGLLTQQVPVSRANISGYRELAGTELVSSYE